MTIQTQYQGFLVIGGFFLGMFTTAALWYITWIKEQRNQYMKKLSDKEYRSYNEHLKKIQG